MKVTGHGFDPGVRHADDWASQIIIGKSNTFEHCPCACTITSVRDNRAVSFGIECHNLLLLLPVSQHKAPGDSCGHHTLINPVGIL